MRGGFHSFCARADDFIYTLIFVYRSAYLFGRERRIADVPIDHPSCSKQHAVLQYRLKTVPPPPGSLAPPARAVVPYLLDLESANGTFLNGERVDHARYIELKERDQLEFAHSTRKYVLLHERSAGGGGGGGAGGAAGGK